MNFEVSAPDVLPLTLKTVAELSAVALFTLTLSPTLRLPPITQPVPIEKLLVTEPEAPLKAPVKVA